VRGLAALVLCLALVWPAAAQAPDPPCAPGVAPSATFRTSDLTATHPIDLLLETSEDEIREFEVALPPGAVRDRWSSPTAFHVEAPGPVPITATWRHFVIEDAAYCTASAATTLNVEPAKALRYIPPPRSKGYLDSLDWRVRIGKGADLRPVQVQIRGVRRARLPRRPLKRSHSPCAGATRGCRTTAGPCARCAARAGTSMPTCRRGARRSASTCATTRIARDGVSASS
jgi:hypothetical protein